MLTGHPETIQRCCSWWAISDIGVRMQAHASGHRDGLGQLGNIRERWMLSRRGPVAPSSGARSTWRMTSPTSS